MRHRSFLRGFDWVCCILILGMSCGKNPTGPETGTVTDIDGNVYKTVKIGKQWWTAENLKVTHFRNGDAIPNVTGDAAWWGLSTSAWCVQLNTPAYKDTFGLLYNWYAAADERGLAPEGWHVATDEEWKELEMYLGMSRHDADTTFWRGAEANVAGKLKAEGTELWAEPNVGATNESGFTALPGGNRGYLGYFHDVLPGSGNFTAGFWTTSEYDEHDAFSRFFGYSDVAVLREAEDKQCGYSVRLVKD